MLHKGRAILQSDESVLTAKLERAVETTEENRLWDLGDLDYIGQDRDALIDK